MECNMGTTDRYIRTAMGIAFTIFAAMTLKPIMLVPVLIIAYTVSTRWCFLYHLMGINTGCHHTTARKGRNNIIEGLSLSLLLLLMLLLIYLIVRYINH